MKRIIAIVIIITCLFSVEIFGMSFHLLNIKNSFELSLQEQQALIDTNMALADKISEQDAEIEKLNSALNGYKTTNSVDKEYGVFKSYLNYRLFNPKYKPYQLQQTAYTDERGFRRQGEYYFIAIGTGWGFVEGDKVLVVLSTGKSFKAIMGDRKSDAHTDTETHKVTITNSKGTEGDYSVVEFIVDEYKIMKHIGNTGNIATLNEFKGAVIGIYKIGD